MTGIRSGTTRFAKGINVTELKAADRIVVVKPRLQKPKKPNRLITNPKKPIMIMIM